MPNLIDSSLWIDFTRARCPRALKISVSVQVLDPHAAIAEPIMFEIPRYATPIEASALGDCFQAMSILKSPSDLWALATKLGQSCWPILDFISQFLSAWLNANGIISLMTLSLEIAAQTEVRLRQQAAAASQDMQSYLSQVIERVATQPTLDEVLAPLRRQFATKSISDEQLLEDVTAAQSEYRAENRKRTA